VLQPEVYAAEFIAMPDGLKRTTKEGKAEYERLISTGKQVMSASQAKQVEGMRQSILMHSDAAMFLRSMPGQAEVSAFVEVDGINHKNLKAKARFDRVVDVGGEVAIVDLKTTENASPREFSRSIAQWRYFLQASWYLDGIEQSTGTRPEQFIFICVEKKAPFACAVYAADAEMIAAGAQTAARDLEVLATCKAADAWPGYSDQIEPISLPAWMRPGSTQQQPPTEIEMY
jgi:hypothetical protein